MVPQFNVAFTQHHRTRDGRDVEPPADVISQRRSPAARHLEVGCAADGRITNLTCTTILLYLTPDYTRAQTSHPYLPSSTYKVDNNTSPGRTHTLWHHQATYWNNSLDYTSEKHQNGHDQESPPPKGISPPVNLGPRPSRHTPGPRDPRPPGKRAQRHGHQPAPAP